MKTILKTKAMLKNMDNKLVDRVVELMFRADELPELPPNEMVKLEHAIALDHLYHSSALEGSRLDEDQIRLAINGGH